MEYKFLGNIGIKVSKLAFGTLTINSLEVKYNVKRFDGVINKILKKN